jgi:hypothetical protein
LDIAMNVFHFPADGALQDDVEHRRSGYAADHLRDDVGDRLAGLEAARRHQSARHGRIEMATRNRTYRIRHCQHGGADRKRDRDEPHGRCRKQRRAANRRHQHERPNELCTQLFCHFRILPLRPAPPLGQGIMASSDYR